MKALRKDINGLRALAVLGVVVFHFKPDWMAGGYAGVDVFFVISGFLMTSIIFRGLTSNNFSLWKFYIARANRIIPALAILCVILLFIGMMILTPFEYKELGKHIVASMGFFSNIVYWLESGYFDSSSHEKWLLHTWSLSVEWQFYLLYPLLLALLYKLMPIRHLKVLLLICTILSFLLCVYLTYKSPSMAYYLLPARIWQMLLGGLAFIYPLSLSERNKSRTESIGLLLILASYLIIKTTTPWPGYLALMPVIGAFLVIQSNRQHSAFIGNFIFQKIGAWSYSIYLWHWPFAVAIYNYSLSDYWIIVGLSLSILMGYLSYQFVEQGEFRQFFSSRRAGKTSISIAAISTIMAIASYVYLSHGASAISSDKLLSITTQITPSPMREKCHTGGDNYTQPNDACTYFNNNVTWAVIGDSHSVELAYALAEKLELRGQGLKHLSFSGCKPSFGQNSTDSNCTKWTNDSVNTLLESKNILNIVVSYRYSLYLHGSQLSSYPKVPSSVHGNDRKQTMALDSLSMLIESLAKSKKNVFVVKPVPELGSDINKLIRKAYRSGVDVSNIPSTSIEYYQSRNAMALTHLNGLEHLENVTLIDAADLVCDKQQCWAVKDGVCFYLDDNHLSIPGARILANEIFITDNQ